MNSSNDNEPENPNKRLRQDDVQREVAKFDNTLALAVGIFVLIIVLALVYYRANLAPAGTVPITIPATATAPAEKQSTTETPAMPATTEPAAPATPATPAN
jgi:hypothetical protein